MFVKSIYDLIKKNILLICLFLFLGCLTTSCGSHESVKNLTSDVCLVLPENNTKSDVLNILGKPNQIRIHEEDNKTEDWVYYQVHKSFLKKIPLINKKYGSEDFDVVIVTFNNDKVTACLYRSLTRKQLSEHGVELNAPSSEE